MSCGLTESAEGHTCGACPRTNTLAPLVSTTGRRFRELRRIPSTFARSAPSGLHAGRSVVGPLSSRGEAGTPTCTRLQKPRSRSRRGKARSRQSRRVPRGPSQKPRPMRNPLRRRHPHLPPNETTPQGRTATPATQGYPPWAVLIRHFGAALGRSGRANTLTWSCDAPRRAHHATLQVRKNAPLN